MDKLLESDFQSVLRNNKENDISYNRSFFYGIRKSLKSNKLAMISLIILFIIILASLLASISPYNPDEMDLASALQEPSLQHIFGTDDLGRDYFTRALYGGRISILVGFSSMIIAVAFGTIIGAISGFVGGKVDAILMRFVDIFMSVPSLLLIIVINTFITPNIFTIIIIIGMFAWMGVARIVRAQTLTLKERDYVLAAKSLGVSNVKIIFNHIIPNMISEIIVAASISIARAILQESTLSFLGFGIQLPKSSWGSMLQGAQKYILDMPFLALIPGMLILLTVLSFNILGDALRNALEPKMTR